MTRLKGRVAAVLWTIVGAVAIPLAIIDMHSGEDSPVVGIELELDGDEDASAEPLGERDALEQVWVELSKQYVEGNLDHDGVRRTLKRHRLAVNLQLVEPIAQSRKVWFQRFEMLMYAGLQLTLVMLLGPLWIYRRSQDDRLRKAIASVPYFVASTATILVVGRLLIGFVIDIQELQATLGVFGNLVVAGTDGAIHYLAYSNDQELTALMSLLFRARDMIGQDPLGAAGLLEHLWVAADAVKQSSLLTTVHHAIADYSWLFELYAPLLAAAAAILVYKVLRPVIEDLLRYPIRAMEGKAETLWQLFKRQAGLLWRELRAVMWTLLFILVFVALSVVALRALTFFFVVASIKILLATERLMAAGAALPDVSVFCATLSMAVFLVVAMVCCLAPSAVILSRAYSVVRARYRTKRRFREFGVFWATVKRLLSRVMGPALLAAATVLAVYFAALALLQGQPQIRIWLATPLFGPAMCLLIWRLRLLPALNALSRVDPLG